MNQPQASRPQSLLNIRPLAIALLASILLILAGCQTTNPYTGETEVSKTTKGAGIGAIGGAIAGAAAIGVAAHAVASGISRVTGKKHDRIIEKKPRESEEATSKEVNNG